MPEYILNNGGRVGRVALHNLDAFTQGYIEAMFFTNECPGVYRADFHTKAHKRAMAEGRASGTIPCDVGYAQLSRETLANIIRECKDFRDANRDDLNEATDNGRIDGYDETQAGRDFWYSRNGYGVGYFDSDLGEVGDRLQEAARRCGERNAYYARGRVWVE